MTDDAHPTAGALLDAVDAILASDDARSLSLRQVEVAADASHGSVRYHFGSLDGLLVAAFSRRNDDLVARQVEMYRSRRSLGEKWRMGSRVFFDADIASGWSRRAFEMTRLAIEQPELRPVIQAQIDSWFELLAEVVWSANHAHDLGLTEQQVRGITMTVAYSQFGAMATELHGGHPWHEHYLAVWDELIERVESRPSSRGNSDDRNDHAGQRG